MSGLSEAWGNVERGMMGADAWLNRQFGNDDYAKLEERAGDQVAADQGVHIDQKQLGETDDPTELVHGDPEAIGKVQQVFTAYARSYRQIGDGIRGIDAHDWQGQAADGFRRTRDKHSKDWETGAETFQQAAAVLGAHAQVVTWGQKQAAEAIRLWNQAKQQYQAAAKAHNQQVKQYNQHAAAFNAAASAGGNPGQAPTPPGNFVDPSTETKRQAQAILKRAREQVHTSGSEAKTKLEAAGNALPPIPAKNVRAQMDEETMDTALNEGGRHVVSGLVDSASSTIGMVRSNLPMDPYNMSHPSEYADHMVTQGAGLMKMANHPQQLVKGVVHEWQTDPQHALGELAGDMAGGGMVGGVGKGVAKSVAKSAGKEAAETVGKDAAKTAGNEAARAGEHAAQRGMQQAGHGLGDVERDLGNLDGKMRDPGNVERAQPDVPSGAHRPPPESAGTRPESSGAPAFDRAGSDAGRLHHDIQQRYQGGHDTAPAHAHTPDPAPAEHHTPPHQAPKPEAAPKQQLDNAGHNLSKIEQRLAGLDDHMHDPGPVERAHAPQPEPAGPDFAHSDRRMYDPNYEADTQTLDRYLLTHRTTESSHWLDKTRQQWPEAGQLHDAELLSLRDYTSNEGIDWNSALRGQHDIDPDELSTNVRTLNSALNKLPDHTGEVKRVIDLPPDELRDFVARHHQAAEDGTPIAHPHAQSASQGDSKFPGNVEYRIESRHGKDLSPINPKEREITFPPGQHLRPLDVWKDPSSGRWVIRMADGGRQ